MSAPIVFSLKISMAGLRVMFIRHYDGATFKLTTVQRGDLAAAILSNS